MLDSLNQLICDMLNGKTVDWIRAMQDIIVDRDFLFKNANRIYFAISLILETCPLSDQDRELLLDTSDMVIEHLVIQRGKYGIIPKADIQFNEGYFVDSKAKLGEIVSEHEHFHITNGVLQLTETYYMDRMGLKCREVTFPSAYQDPGFLLDNTLLSEREQNMAILADDADMFNI